MSNKVCFYISSFSTTFLEPGESPSQLNLISASIYQKIQLLLLLSLLLLLLFYWGELQCALSRIKIMIIFYHIYTSFTEFDL